MPDLKLTLVVACALVDADNRVLLAQRPAGKALAGLWEFPGGKVEPGETPEAALIRDQRKILDMTATSWLSFREFNGLLVYYTHLMSYRCAIREVRIGIDTAVPDKVLKMPACNSRDPSAIPSDAQP